MKKLVGIFLIILFAAACNRVREKANDTVNKGGKAVGETATEFIGGVVEGVDNTIETKFDSKIVLSEELTKKGISIGKCHVEKGSLGKDNKLVVYIISENDFNGTLTFKVFDKNNAEYGRQTIEVNSKAGEAGYHDILFDPRTDIESKSTIKIN